jgi:hypothetical protein
MWLADINEGRSAQIFCVESRIASKWPNMSLQRPTYAWGVRWRAIEGHVTPVDSDYAYIRWSLRSKISRSTAISLTEQLKSQLPQVQQLATRRIVPYIVRDSQWQRGITPTVPSMTHPARRVVPNGLVGQKLQHFKCISKASQ